MKRWWGWVFVLLGVAGLLFSLGIETNFDPEKAGVGGSIPSLATML